MAFSDLLGGAVVSASNPRLYWVDLGAERRTSGCYCAPDGRVKNYARIVQFLEQDAVDADRLNRILAAAPLPPRV
ncbi:MAG TPA: hypothetical protein VMT05_12045 [Terriglobales bacterium]|nr:hypothetical protein [Terriglobales bacterium]